MQALRAAHLAEVLAELRPLCEGARVREVQPLPPRDLLLILEPGEEGGPAVRRLRLSCDPDGPRAHLQQGRAFRHKGPIGPFFERAAKLLEGSTIATVEQPRGDRIALLRFRNADGDVPRPVVVAELTGRHANLVLLDAREQVLAMLIAPPAKGARPPRLTVGEPWVPPPGKPVGNDDQPPLAELLEEPEPDDDERPRRIEAPLSWRVEWHLGGAADGARSARASKALRQRLERKLSRARSLAAGLERRREAAAGAERVLQDAELLKAAMAQLSRGMASIELEDWYGEAGARRTVALDPKLSPNENVQKQFDRYHKLLRSTGELERESELAAGRIATLEELLRSLEDGAEPATVEARAVEAKLLDALVQDRAKRVQKKDPRLPYRSFTGARGGEILVGRNSRDNDELTLRIARGNDLWLHTADSPGSHVILRTARNVEPHPEDILDAAHLAAHFSPLKDARRVAIHVVQRKHIRKPKGAPAGLVQVGAGKVRQIRVEADRLERLLKPVRGGGGDGPDAAR